MTLFQELYLPILEELQLPYILLYDFFAMAAFVPKDIDPPTFKRARGTIPALLTSAPSFGVAASFFVQTL